LGDGQSGSWLAERGVKNRPFEPLSITLLYVAVVPLIIVIISPDWSVGYLVTPDGTLLVWVPMPRTSTPATEDVPLEGTLGSITITPLLSWGRSATGFWT
jgi:hypothetical protein